ncbi:unnamed protein product [Schistocephalus solidus]|uniref:Homeobox domain-containing protein n=1 Tax=Schistocephalus solidus TaxID=70667 RepID=A0A183SE12_SCHSO|nr:unnamed protein product [Schistocephalus solidus]
MGNFAADHPTLHLACRTGDNATGLGQRIRCPKVGRSPRVPFTRAQIEGLEAKFKVTNYLSSREVTNLAASLNVTETRVKIWFQNRRARQRREAFFGEILRSNNGTRSMNAPCTSVVPAATTTVAASHTENRFVRGKMLEDILETSPSTQAAFPPAANYCQPVECLVYPSDCLRTHEATVHGLGSYLVVNLDPTASVTATVP